MSDAAKQPMDEERVNMAINMLSAQRNAAQDQLVHLSIELEMFKKKVAALEKAAAESKEEAE